jgi:hypothetical protein
MRRIIGAPTTGAVGSGISSGSGKSPVPSPAASANALAVVLPPDVLYHDTRHNIRTLTFRAARRKAIGQNGWTSTQPIVYPTGPGTTAWRRPRPSGVRRRRSPAHRFWRSARSVLLCRRDASTSATDSPAQPTDQRRLAARLHQQPSWVHESFSVGLRTTIVGSARRGDSKSETARRFGANRSTIGGCLKQLNVGCIERVSNLT